MYDTALVQLPLWLWKMTGGRFIGSKVEPLVPESDVDGDESNAVLGATAANPVGEAKRRRAKARQRS
jgi:hypothetical protein